MSKPYTLNAKRFLTGFTLIELLIAVGIFAVAAVGITGGLLRLNSVQKIARDREAVLNELRFAIEVFGQEVLSGSAFPDSRLTFPDGNPGDGCVYKDGCDSIAFATKIRPDVPLRRIEYCLDSAPDPADGCPGIGGNVIMRAEQHTFGDCQNLPFQPKCFQPLTSAKAQISSLRYFADHKADDLKPIITVSVDGIINNEPFQLSSSFSPRLQQDPLALPPNDTEKPEVTITLPVPDCDLVSGSFTRKCTSQPTVSLQGSASDNVGVMKIEWWNDASKKGGIVWQCGVGNGCDPLGSGDLLVSPWNSPSITLIPGTVNPITISATDQEGNVGSDTLEVRSTAGLATPTLTGAKNCSATGQERIRLSWNNVSGATPGGDYHIYRCDGSCTPTSEIATDSLSPFYNSTTFPSAFPIIPGNPYSYRIRAHSHTSGAFSGYSNTVTVTAPTLAECPDYHFECISSTCTRMPGVFPPSVCSSQGACCGGSCGIPGGSASFTLSANPRVIGAKASGTSTTKNSSDTTTITVNPSGGFSAVVSLTASGGPSGIEYRFCTGASLDSSEYSSPGCKFFVRILDSTPLGDYNLTITGSGGGKTASVIVVLSVSKQGGGQK